MADDGIRQSLVAATKWEQADLSPVRLTPHSEHEEIPGLIIAAYNPIGSCI
jgi:hypothetical protein